MLAFNWKFLTPLSLVVLMTTAILDKALKMVGIGIEPGSAPWLYTAWMLLANMFIGWLTIYLLNKIEPNMRKRRQEFETRPVATTPKSTDLS